MLADEAAIQAHGKLALAKVHREKVQNVVESPAAISLNCAGDLLEVRRAAGYTSNPAISGLFAFAGELGTYHVAFESQAERHHLVEATWEDARFLATQPALFEWQYGRLRVSHVPDILVERHDGTRLLIDVHARRNNPNLEADFVLKARLTAVVAAALGWDYQVVEPLPRQRARNLEHFAAFAVTSARVRTAAERILKSTVWPRSIGGILADADNARLERNVALAATFHLVWHKNLWLDVSLPVRTHTVLRDRPALSDYAKPWVRDLRRR